MVCFVRGQRQLAGLGLDTAAGMPGSFAAASAPAIAGGRASRLLAGANRDSGLPTQRAGAMRIRFPRGKLAWCAAGLARIDFPSGAASGKVEAPGRCRVVPRRSAATPEGPPECSAVLRAVVAA